MHWDLQQRYWHIYDLCLLGYQALDIGHIDIEYEWMKMGTLVQTKIEGKHVNEVVGGDDFGDCEDPRYLSEIIYECC